VIVEERIDVFVRYDRKKLFGIVLVIVISLVLCRSSVGFAENSTIPTNAVAISTANELVAFAKSINADSTGGEGKYYVLTNNINMGGASWSTYIGKETNPFKGTFDGGGHTISNFTMTTSGGTVGLFGYIGGYAKIFDLGFKDVTATLTEKWSWSANAGALAGVVMDNAEISRCFAKNTSLILNWVRSSNQEGNYDCGGGLIGELNGAGVSVIDCYSLGFIGNGAEINYDGGVVGSATAVKIIKNCYSDTTLVRCINTQAVNAVQNSYFVVTPGWPWIGTSGDCYPGTQITVSYLRDLETTLGSAFVKGTSANGGYPAFAWEPKVDAITGTGTVENPYIIANLDNLTEVSMMKETAGKYFKLTNNIDLNGSIWSTYIGTTDYPFKGNFNGDGYIIKNFIIAIPGSDIPTGLFGVTDGEAIITKLGVENVSVDAKAVWRQIAGGIIGRMSGNSEITDCYVRNFTLLYKDTTNIEINCLGCITGQATGNGVSIKNCYSFNVDIPDGNADNDGGIIGLASAFKSIENCYSTGTIARLSNTADVTKVVNSYYLASAPWPAENYAGARINTTELKASDQTLGTSYKVGGMETIGYPTLAWETTTELTLDIKETAVESGKTDFVYQCEFVFNKGQEVFVGFGNNQVFDEKELLLLNDSGLKIGEQLNMGEIKSGKYTVNVNMNFTQKNILVTVTLPDGGIIKRGDSHLFYDLTCATRVVTYSTEKDVIINNGIAKYLTVIPATFVLKDEPQLTGLDANVYNLVSSFDSDAKTTRSFAWTAVKGFDNMEVKYKEAEAQEWLTAEAVLELAKDTVNQGVNYFKADLTALNPGTTYLYKIGKTGSTFSDDWSKEYKFTTEAENTTDFKFIAISDTQGRKWDTEFKYANAAITAAVTDAKNPAFILNAGDVVESGGDETAWNAYFKAIKGVVESVPHFTTPGNHDTWTNAQWSDDEMGIDMLFNLHFNHPNNGGTAAVKGITVNDLSENNKSGRNLLNNLDETIYSFNYGNAHFVVLNSGTYINAEDDKKILNAQREWLINDLEANADAKWKIVMTHQPVYSSNYTFDSQNVLQDVIETYGVDLFINGHEHWVARTYPIKNKEIITKKDVDIIIKNTGTVYSIIGATTPLHRNHITDAPTIYEHLMYANGVYDEQPVYTVADVSDDKLEITTKQLNGLVVSNYSILSADTKIIDVTKDNEKVTAISQLQTGDTATVNFHYMNNTMAVENCTIIAGYYNKDGILVSTQLIVIDAFEAGKTNVIRSFDFKVKNITDVQEIRFFAWDSANNLRPITNKCYSIK